MNSRRGLYSPGEGPAKRARPKGFPSFIFTPKTAGVCPAAASLGQNVGPRVGECSAAA